MSLCKATFEMSRPRRGDKTGESSFAVEADLLDALIQATEGKSLVHERLTTILWFQGDPLAQHKSSVISATSLEKYGLQLCASIMLTVGLLGATLLKETSIPQPWSGISNVSISLPTDQICYWLIFFPLFREVKALGGL